MVSATRGSSAMTDNRFDFLFFFTVDEIRWWWNKVRSMGIIVFDRRQERCMEYIMNAPLHGECESISYRAEDVDDSEWSFMFW